MKKLTDRQVKNLKPKKERYEVWEGNGFGIRVFPSGKKSWVYMYRFQSTARRITFGQYPKMSVALAHEAYGKAMADLEKGIDPGINKVDSNEANRQAPTVNFLIDEYIEKWAKPRKRSWKEDKRLLEKEITPVIGRRKAKDIKRREIIHILDKIVERGSPIAANRTLAVTRRMFNFAIERDLIQTTPCYLVKAPAKENQKDRLLNEEEIKAFWHGLDGASMSSLTKIALKFQLVTAQRKGEIISAEWKEFDLKKGWWEIPGSKTKNSKTHRVPLSKLALSLLDDLKKLSEHASWLFPSPKDGMHISGPAIDKSLRRNQQIFIDEPATPHDLRRTAASHMTALGAPRLVVSKILNHADNSVTAVYDRHKYENEKKKALDAWGKTINGIISTKKHRN